MVIKIMMMMTMRMMGMMMGMMMMMMVMMMMMMMVTGQAKYGDYDESTYQPGLLANEELLPQRVTFSTFKSALAAKINE